MAIAATDVCRFKTQKANLETVMAKLKVSCSMKFLLSLRFKHPWRHSAYMPASGALQPFQFLGICMVILGLATIGPSCFLAERRELPCS